MTALDRAKRFVTQHAIKTALVIVPLAAASAAGASPIAFNPAGATAVAGGSGVLVGSQSGSFAQLPNGGVQFSGDYFFDLSSGGSFTTQLTLSGTGSGGLSLASIPALYNLSFLFPNLDVSNLTSSLTFFINGLSVGGPYSNFTGSVGLTGWATVPPDPLATWSVVLQAAGIGVVIDSNLPGQIHLIPQIAITPPQNATVPEPASLLLLGCGIMLLVIVGRRRLRSRPD